MSFMELIDSLFRRGLGELPVFYSRLRGLYLGNMVYAKGRIFFKDQGFLKDMELPDEPPDWEQYVLGMVCYRRLLQWESLSFFGLDYCESIKPVNAEQADNLKRITGDDGERLYDFVGSIYRACHMMLDHDLLPVVLLRPIETKSSGMGLMVADLTALIPRDSDHHSRIKAVIRDAVRKRATLDLEDITENEID